MLVVIDLSGKIACFPADEGAAFSSVTETLHTLKLISNNCSSSVKNFFSRKSCFGNQNLKYCSNFNGDDGAFQCLKQHGDIAFINLETFKNLTGL